jgi:hypothetical protein
MVGALQHHVSLLWWQFGILGRVENELITFNFSSKKRNWVLQIGNYLTPLQIQFQSLLVLSQNPWDSQSSNNELVILVKILRSVNLYGCCRIRVILFLSFSLIFQVDLSINHWKFAFHRLSNLRAILWFKVEQNRGVTQHWLHSQG